ncbi:hypothetical protein ACFY04_09250 [Streptomyces sp. NPDC001549]|uniref:hypothetical protein n=1 Tax=Streptomyces sp. NPDC001549 TaxID=3364586 RepID=UPI0036A6D670
MSRRAAQQRLAAASAPGAPAGGGLGSPARRILALLTAFNEMAALDEAGRDGGHLVGHGAFFHAVEASAHAWEHCRVTLSAGGRHRRMEAEGWIPVGAGRFPWWYCKRPPGPGKEH